VGPLFFEGFEKLGLAQGIDDILFFEPPSSRDSSTEFSVPQGVGGVGVRVDDELDAFLLRFSNVVPRDVLPRGLGVDLNPGPGFNGLLEQSIVVNGVTFSVSDQAPREVADNGDVWVFHRFDDSGGIVFCKPSMDRGDHDIHLLQDLVRVIEFSIGEDVDLCSHKELNLHLLLYLHYFRQLFGDILFLESIGDNETW